LGVHKLGKQNNIKFAKISNAVFNGYARIFATRFTLLNNADKLNWKVSSAN